MDVKVLMFYKFAENFSLFGHMVGELWLFDYFRLVVLVGIPDSGIYFFYYYSLRMRYFSMKLCQSICLYIG